MEYEARTPKKNMWNSSTFDLYSLKEKFTKTEYRDVLLWFCFVQKLEQSD